MNRFQLDRPTDFSNSPSTQVAQAKFIASDPATVPHSVFAPLHYERNYAYPLLVWLHGPGDDERQLQRVMPLISMRNYVAVGPRGCATCDVAAGYCWEQTPADIASTENRVMDCISEVGNRFNVAADRVFIGGYQCGGTMAFRIGLKFPERFAGVLSIGGPFPTGLTPLANLRMARGLPLFIAQGREDETYPTERSCDELRLFHSAGFAVTLRQYPCGNQLTDQMLHDMDVWMMQLVTGVSMSDDEQQLPDDIN